MGGPFLTGPVTIGYNHPKGGDPVKTIILVQHTQSEHHLNGMVGSVTDWPLTEQGREEARHIAERLHTELGGVPIRLYTSDLRRARQTAEPIAARFGAELLLRPALRERDLGIACGKSVQWLREHMTSPERTVDDRLFPDAESRRDVWDRLGPFLDELLAEDGDVAVVVSHGDLLSVFTARFLGLTPEALDTGELYGQSGGVSFLELRPDGRRRVRCFSDTSYMK